MSLLYIATITLAALLLVAGIYIEYRKRNPLDISTTEWRERLAKLGTVKPMASRIEGKPGVVSPLKKQRPKLKVMRRRTGTK